MRNFSVHNICNFVKYNVVLIEWFNLSFFVKVAVVLLPLVYVIATLPEFIIGPNLKSFSVNFLCNIYENFYILKNLHNDIWSTGFTELQIRDMRKLHEFEISDLLCNTNYRLQTHTTNQSNLIQEMFAFNKNYLNHTCNIQKNSVTILEQQYCASINRNFELLQTNKELIIKLIQKNEMSKLQEITCYINSLDHSILIYSFFNYFR